MNKVIGILSVIIVVFCGCQNKSNSETSNSNVYSQILNSKIKQDIDEYLKEFPYLDSVIALSLIKYEPFRTSTFLIYNVFPSMGAIYKANPDTIIKYNNRYVIISLGLSSLNKIDSTRIKNMSLILPHEVKNNLDDGDASVGYRIKYRDGERMKKEYMKFDYEIPTSKELWNSSRRR